MPYQIEVKHCEPMYTAVIRGRVPKEDLSKFVPTACGEVWSFIRSAGLPRPGRHVALYLNDGEGSIEVGAEVGEQFSGTERIQCSRHGHPRAGASWEIYGHWQESWNADPSKIRTDVFYLLEDQKM